MKILRIFFVMFMALLAIPALVFAGDETSINLQPALDYGLEIIGGILLALVSWGVTWLGRKFKLDALSPELEKIVDEGIKFGLGKVKRWAGSNANIDLHNETAAEALGYVLRNGPKTAKKMGYSPEQLREKIMSKLDLGENDAQPSNGSAS